MAIDVIANVEDYRKFLSEIKSQGAYKLVHHSGQHPAPQLNPKTAPK
jgi:hypothetical protein